MACFTDRLQDIIAIKANWNTTFFIKCLPRSVEAETVVDHLKAKYDRDVRLIYRSQRWSTQSIVLLNKPLDVASDVTCPLSDVMVTIRPLGTAVGVIACPVTETVGEIDIRRYFTSVLKSDGRSGKVKKVEFLPGGFIIVSTQNEKDIESLLAQKDLALQSNTLYVLPYFVPLHDVLIDELGLLKNKSPQTGAEDLAVIVKHKMFPGQKTLPLVTSATGSSTAVAVKPKPKPRISIKSKKPSDQTTPMYISNPNADSLRRDNQSTVQQKIPPLTLPKPPRSQGRYECTSITPPPPKSSISERKLNDHSNLQTNEAEKEEQQHNTIMPDLHSVDSSNHQPVFLQNEKEVLQEEIDSRTLKSSTHNQTSAKVQIDSQQQQQQKGPSLTVVQKTETLLQYRRQTISKDTDFTGDATTNKTSFPNKPEIPPKTSKATPIQSYQTQIRQTEVSGYVGKAQKQIQHGAGMSDKFEQKEKKSFKTDIGIQRKMSVSKLIKSFDSDKQSMSTSEGTSEQIHEEKSSGGTEAMTPKQFDSSNQHETQIQKQPVQSPDLVKKCCPTGDRECNINGIDTPESTWNLSSAKVKLPKSSTTPIVPVSKNKTFDRPLFAISRSMQEQIVEDKILPLSQEADGGGTIPVDPMKNDMVEGQSNVQATALETGYAVTKLCLPHASGPVGDIYETTEFSDSIAISSPDERLLLLLETDNAYSSQCVTIKITKGKITILSTSQQIVRETKLKMFELISSFEHTTRSLPPHIGLFLLDEEPQSKLREMLNQSNIKADFEIHATKNIINWTACSEADLDSANDILNNNVEAKELGLEQRQEDLIQHILQTYNRRLPWTAVFRDTKTLRLYIVGGFGGNAEELEMEIRAYIRDQELERMASCLNKDVSENATSDVKTTDPCEIQTEPTMTDNKQQTADKWCERFDMSAVSQNVTDVAILNHIITAPSGVWHLRYWEAQLNCTINVDNRSEDDDEDNIYENFSDLWLPGTRRLGAEALEDTGLSSMITGYDLRSGNYSKESRRTLINIQQGEIAKFQADALVNVASPDFSLSGVISETFKAIGGSDLVRDYEDEFHQLSTEDDDWICIHSPGVGGLLCGSVIHAGLRRTKNDEEMKQCLDAVVKRLVDECNARNYKSLALPPLGVGRMYRYPEDIVARQLYESLQAHLTDTTLTEVTIVVFDQALFARYSSQFDKWQTSSDVDGNKNVVQLAVYAATKVECLSAIEYIKQRIREDLLYEEKLSLNDVPPGAEQEVKRMLEGMAVYIAKENHAYILKGERGQVKDALDKAKNILLKVLSKSLDRKQKTEETAKENLPNYWSIRKDSSSNDQRYVLIPLSSTDAVYTSIERLVIKSFDRAIVGIGRDAKGLLHSTLRVKKIERIENMHIFGKYSFRKNTMKQCLHQLKKTRWPKIEDLPGSEGPVNTMALSPELGVDLLDEINEVYLLHGSKHEYAKVICHDGLDARLSSDCGMLGRGVYGAEMSTKADQYTDDRDRRRRLGEDMHMFVIRVLLGNCYLSTAKKPPRYVRAPCCQCEGDRCAHECLKYDSVLGQNGKLFREFVVYHVDQCYPEYLITYERR